MDDDTPDVDEHLRRLPLQIRVYEITGPLFFGAADAIEHIVVKDFTTWPHSSYEKRACP